MTYLPIRYSTYTPQDCTDPRCIVCGQRMTIHRPERSDDPTEYECIPCIRREAYERKKREAPIRRFENGGMMLRWTMNNNTGWAFTSAWIRLMGMILNTDSEIVEQARWKA